MWDAILADRRHPSRKGIWPKILSREDLKKYMEACDANNPGSEEFAYIIRDETGALAGTFHVHTINWEAREAEIGYGLHLDFTGRGLATRAVRIAERFLRDIGFFRLLISTAEWNHSSSAVAERSGFKLVKKFHKDKECTGCDECTRIYEKKIDGFSFAPFASEHLSFFRHWLLQPHVRSFWQETSNDGELANKFLVELPRRGVHAFAIMRAGEPIGFIQYYDATKVGGGWWENERPGTFGIDLLIGEAALLGRGFGPKVIREFIDFLRGREPSVTQIITDPAPNNARAVRAFEKVGFLREGEIVTPGGPALLMRMK